MAISLFSLLIPFLFLAGVSATPSIGVTYRHSLSSALSPEQVAATLQRQKISSVRLLNPDPSIIRAFSYSDVSLLLSIPNSQIHALSTNTSNAGAWVVNHVLPFYPRARISVISVGDDVFSADSDLADHILPAIRNLHVALHELGIRKIAVSTTLSFVSSLTTAFPPSAGEFLEPVHEVLIKNLLDFLEEANSSLLIHVHPYSLYRLDKEIPIGFALFQEGAFSFRDDFTTGVRYRNLFDTMVDAVLSAMAVAGHENIPIVVTETGWPSSPGDGIGEEIDANKVFAEIFMRGLVKHLKSGIGTPLKNDGVSEVYIFELFDGERKNKSSTVPFRQWGILYPNMTPKFDIDFMGSFSSPRFRTNSWMLALLAFGHGIAFMFTLLG